MASGTGLGMKYGGGGRLLGLVLYIFSAKKKIYIYFLAPAKICHVFWVLTCSSPLQVGIYYNEWCMIRPVETLGHTFSFFFFSQLIWERWGERHWFAVLFLHAFICCFLHEPWTGLNPKPWLIGMTHQLTGLPSQGPGNSSCCSGCLSWSQDFLNNTLPFLLSIPPHWLLHPIEFAFQRHGDEKYPVGVGHLSVPTMENRPNFLCLITHHPPAWQSI